MAALSHSISDLFEPSDFEVLCPHWVGTFAHRRQFRLMGFNEFARDRLARVDDAELQALLPDALKLLPASWIDRWRSGDWDSLRHEQYARAGEVPLRFDKACLVIAVAALQAERASGFSGAICDLVKLAPAVFVVEGFDKDFFRNRMKNDFEIYGALAVASGGQNNGFLGEILQGHLMTYKTAKGIAGKLATMRVPTSVFAYRHNNPAAAKKVPKPAPNERVMAPA